MSMKIIRRANSTWMSAETGNKIREHYAYLRVHPFANFIAELKWIIEYDLFWWI